VTRSKELQISAPAAAAPQTPEHKRFYTLIRQIEKARQSVTAWRDQILGFRKAYTEVLRPLRDSAVAAMTEWVFALDGVLGQRDWTRAERAMLRDMVCRDVSQLLAARPDDALKNLFDKYSRVDFDTEKQQELAVLKEFARAFSGVDLGDTSTIHSEEDLEQRIYEQMAARQEARKTQQAERAQRRRKSAAQERREDEAKRVTQSVREIFRKLVSALHPDREPDPELRATKTGLMQKVNRAYETNDLLTLLEVQLQIEQVSPSQIHNAGAERLKHYNKVLAEQLSGLKLEIQRVQAEFEMEFALETHSSDPRQLGPLVHEQARLLRSELSRQQRDLRMLSDVAATKRWLKRQQQERRRAERDDDFF